MPITPISAPWIMKIAVIDDGDAPSVRRIAMSACLSVTVITCADTMLNAATAMISVRMMNITRFSICTARKKLAWLASSRGLRRSTLRRPASSRATRGAAIQVVELEPHARHAVQPVELLRVVEVDQREAAVELVHADLEDADHAEALEARQRAGGGHRALRRDDDHRIAEPHAERARELGAEHDAELAGLQIASSDPARMCASDVGDRRFARRIDAADRARRG